MSNKFETVEEKSYQNKDGFYYDGIHKSGDYYNELDLDFFGYDRVFIQHFLMHFRRFLDIKNLSLNVYSVIAFNDKLEEFLNENDFLLEDLIQESLINKKKFNENYNDQLTEIYDINFEKIKLNLQKHKKIKI